MIPLSPLLPRALPTRKTPSRAFSTTSWSRTFLDLRISTIPLRDAVAATGLRFEELVESKAVNLGCLSAVQRLQRGGRLSRQELICEAAAMSGQLEELKLLRADGWPWDAETCAAAARGGHLEVLRWALANGYLWDEWT